MQRELAMRGHIAEQVAQDAVEPVGHAKDGEAFQA